MKYILSIIFIFLIVDSKLFYRYFGYFKGQCIISENNEFSLHPSIYKILKGGSRMYQVKVKFNFEKEPVITEFTRYSVDGHAIVVDCPKELE